MKAYFVLLFIVLMPIALGATITGTVYDYDLSPVKGAVVQINTAPPQTIVAVDGTFSLDVPQGSYVLKVSKKSGTDLVEHAQSEVEISGEGTYTFDMILFQEIQEIEEPDFTLPKERNYALIILSVVGVLLIIVGLVLLVQRKKLVTKKVVKTIINEDDLPDQIFKIIKKEKRITQKDLRKQFPLAEATVSLAISELEHKGLIEKIKKGRGNIIMLKKD